MKSSQPKPTAVVSESGGERTYVFETTSIGQGDMLPPHPSVDPVAGGGAWSPRPGTIMRVDGSIDTTPLPPRGPAPKREAVPRTQPFKIRNFLLRVRTDPQGTILAHSLEERPATP